MISIRAEWAYAQTVARGLGRGWYVCAAPYGAHVINIFWAPPDALGT